MSKKRVAKVLIVDDHPVVREGLALRIARQPDLEVCGEAADTSDALHLVATTQPDIAIVDISLETGDGLDLIKRMRARNPHLPILVCSMHSESLYADRALRAGAMGYIAKAQATTEIVQAIRCLLDGRVYLTANMTEKLLHGAV